jgi:hypothetical protein
MIDTGRSGYSARAMLAGLTEASIAKVVPTIFFIARP